MVDIELYNFVLKWKKKGVKQTIKTQFSNSLIFVTTPFDLISKTQDFLNIKILYKKNVHI